MTDLEIAKVPTRCERISTCGNQAISGLGLFAILFLAASCHKGPPAETGSEPSSAPAAALPPSRVQDLDALLKSLPDVRTPPFTQTEAMALVAMPLACIDDPQASPADGPFSSEGYLYEYGSGPRLIDNYAENRAFFGCYDWHSAVNSTWAMVEVLKTFPKIPVGQLIREKLDNHLGNTNLKGELAFFQKHPGFEVPFGRAWLLKLYGALLTWQDSAAQRWAKNVAPLAKLFSTAMVKYLNELSDPTRLGEHPNTAYSMDMMLDYAEAAEDDTLKQAIINNAQRLFSKDSDCPTAYEPSGAAFLSPCLAEAKLMSRIMDRAKFVSWFDSFMPPVYSAKFAPLRQPFNTNGITNPRLLAGKSHLIGLGVIRGEAMMRIADALPPGDPRIRVYHRLAEINAEETFKNFEGAGYLGSHWFATYAIRYELAASSSGKPGADAVAHQ